MTDEDNLANVTDADQQHLPSPEELEEAAAVEAELARAEGRMTLWEHVSELRDRLIKCAFAVALGAVIGWVFYDRIFDFLVDPYCASLLEAGGSITGPDGTVSECNLFATDPLEGFRTRVQVAVYSGIFLAMPVLLWQLWRFIAPGLYSHERRYAIPFVFSGMGLFALGAGLAYWTLPRALDFLNKIGGENLQEIYSPGRYLNLVTYMMLAFGIGFEFPIVLIFLQLMGVVTVDQLKSARRYAIVGIVIMVAVITPSGDPISLMALTIPMWIFYEVSIVAGRFLKGRKWGPKPAPA